eukprot:1159122-Pelagomonas_calceolata.AAC.2
MHCAPSNRHALDIYTQSLLGKKDATYVRPDCGGHLSESADVDWFPGCIRVYNSSPLSPRVLQLASCYGGALAGMACRT